MPMSVQNRAQSTVAAYHNASLNGKIKKMYIMTDDNTFHK